MKPEFELILTTESRVISTNLKTFEEQANHYLANLTQTFETDDDFARAKDETKELKAIEDKICNGSLPCNILKTSLYTSP